MSEVPEITQLNEDFTNQRAPFDGATLPEKEALKQIDFSNDELAVLSYGVMLDYNRSADQLWGNILELYKRDTSYFHPSSVVEMDLDEMKAEFQDIGFRYGNRDPTAWKENSQLLVDEFDGSWYALLERADFDAMRLIRLLDSYGFKFLKGDKLAPFYAKVVDANIVSLERTWELPIPVDVHIRRLTQDLAGMYLEDDEIRDFWSRYGKAHDIDPMAVDTALWIVGNQWDDWGEDYWESL